MKIKAGSCSPESCYMGFNPGLHELWFMPLQLVPSSASPRELPQGSQLRLSATPATAAMMEAFPQHTPQSATSLMGRIV